MSSRTHIAAESVEVSGTLRQRCAWCGELLIEMVGERVLTVDVPAAEPPRTWPVGSQVTVIDGRQMLAGAFHPASGMVDVRQYIPADSCAQ